MLMQCFDMPRLCTAHCPRPIINETMHHPSTPPIRLRIISLDLPFYISTLPINSSYNIITITIDNNHTTNKLYFPSVW